jgi:TM2 domain-containing membrane protein YozV
MKSKSTAAILAFFLGGIGIHKFYLNRSGQGILYLLFFWTFIPGLIAFIEFFIYLFMSDREFNAKYNRDFLLFNNNHQLSQNTNVNIVQYFTNSEGDLKFSLRGSKFLNQIELRRISELNYAEELILAPEPSNPYDPNAIKIYTMDKIKIGYIPKEMTKLMRDDYGNIKKHRCIFLKKTDHEFPFVNVKVEFPE